MGIEGYGATAITGNYNAYTRLAPVLTALSSRARSLEMFRLSMKTNPHSGVNTLLTIFKKGLGGER